MAQDALNNAKYFVSEIEKHLISCGFLNHIEKQCNSDV